MVNDIEVQSLIRGRALPLSCGCWIWLKALDGAGYGSLKYSGKLHKAHRLSYQAFVGDIPDGLCVLHKCDNPACVNPDHLEAGTKKENTRQMCERGRARGGPKNPARGEGHWKSKLTDEQVRLIISDHRPYKAIMEDYGIAQSTISGIKTGSRRRFQ